MNAAKQVKKITEAFILLFLAFLPSAQAQETAYSYDPPGNLLNISASGAGPPSITAQPQPQLVSSNASVTLSVNASGPGLSYQWLSNGIPIPGATSDSLVLANPPLSGSNVFSVIVSNASGVVTSSPAALWADVNGNGIPDWWEMQYFGNLNQTAGGDYDGDGVSNLDEYREGTNPANATSYNPRLYLQGFHGQAVASPPQPYYTMGQSVTLTAIPDTGQQFLNWSGSITGINSPITVTMNGHKTITANFGIPLPTALDDTNLVWTTGGNASWFGQTEVSKDGIGAAQSGPMVCPMSASYVWTPQQSCLQAVATLNQPMLLDFWWNVSSIPPDSLTFSIDGTNIASLSGPAVGWQFLATNLSSGTHTLAWTYSKSSSGTPTNSPCSDAGWVDEVNLTSLPLITVQPQSQEASVTYGLNLAVTALGISPFTYQWLQNGIILPNATNAFLSLTNLTPGNAGSYTVVVSNAYGRVTNTVPAVLTVNYPPLDISTFAGKANTPGYTDSLGTAARFNGPYGIAVDMSSNIYVADSGNFLIRKITAAGQVSTLAGSGQHIDMDGTGIGASFNFPTGVAADGAGNVYVADNNGNTVRKITPGGSVITLAGLAGTPGSADGTGSAARFNTPNSVAVDNSGNVYVADFGNHTIRAISTNGDVTTLAGLAGAAGNADGIGHAAHFYYPLGVAVDTVGNVYVADTGNNSIRKVTVSNQAVITLAGGSKGSADGVGTEAQFNAPTGVTVDTSGNVYVADYGNYLIRRVTPGGVVSTVAGVAGTSGSADGIGSAARFGTGSNGPSGVAVDMQSNIYVAEYGSYTIRKGVFDDAAPYAAPLLSISSIGADAILITWPVAATGFSLQQNSSLDSTNWSTVSNPTNVVGNINQVTITPAGAVRYYRLSNGTP